MARLVKAGLSSITANLPKKNYSAKGSPIKAIVKAINETNIDYSNINYDTFVKKIENSMDQYMNMGQNVSIFDYNLTEDTGATSNNTTPTTNSNATNVNGANIKNGNIIDTSSPVTTGTKYQLSDYELAYLAYIAKREQGSIEGAKIELSLMANLYEKNRSRYSGIEDYVRNSGWFASSKSYSYPGDSYVTAAKEVLCDGNRYLSTNVVEHDCISDITGISTGSRSDRSSYIPGKTIITNRYGAKYVFVGFAPNGGDPFGYLV